MRRLAVLIAIPVVMAARCTKRTGQEGSVFRELPPDEDARLARQRALVLSRARELYGTGELKRTRDDLAVVQRLLDDGVFAVEETYELQALGVVLGDVLAGELGMRWVQVTDEYGTDPTLRYADTTLQFNALTMISKRVERGEKVDVQWLFDQTVTQLQALRGNVE